MSKVNKYLKRVKIISDKNNKSFIITINDIIISYIFYGVTLTDYENYELNIAINNLFEKILQKNKLEYKRTNYTNELTILIGPKGSNDKTFSPSSFAPFPKSTKDLAFDILSNITEFIKTMPKITQV